MHLNQYPLCSSKKKKNQYRPGIFFFFFFFFFFFEKILENFQNMKYPPGILFGPKLNPGLLFIKQTHFFWPFLLYYSIDIGLV